jgi:hypothetical protein
MTINLNIGDIVDLPVPINMYMLEVHIVHGDADLYQTIHFDTPSQEKAIEYIALFDDMLAAYPHGRDTSEEDSYRNVEGFEGLLSEDWPRDVTCEDTEASIDGYKVYWYNPLGVKHEVIITYT